MSLAPPASRTQAEAHLRLLDAGWSPRQVGIGRPNAPRKNLGSETRTGPGSRRFAAAFHCMNRLCYILGCGLLMCAVAFEWASKREYGKALAARAETLGASGGETPSGEQARVRAFRRGRGLSLTGVGAAAMGLVACFASLVLDKKRKKARGAGLPLALPVVLLAMYAMLWMIAV